MKKNTPLFKSNPELFKEYVLNFSSDEILIVNGLTSEDKVLASEMQIKIIIRFHTEMIADIDSTTVASAISGMKRRIKNFMASPDTIRQIYIMHPQATTSLQKTKPILFEEYVLKSFSIHPPKGKTQGITIVERRIKNSILALFLYKEVCKLKARIKNQKISIVKAELDQKVQKILQAYERLLPTDPTN